MFSLTSILFVLFLIILTAYIWHIKRAYEFFKKLDIPNPPVTFFFGNYLEIVRSKRLSSQLHKWTQIYGRIFGYFQGHTPILTISDPDILQNIFIQSFSNFHSRRPLPLKDRDQNAVHLLRAYGLRWKRQRLVINPTFSSAKLKQMSSLIHRCAQIFMSKMSKECSNGQPFDIYAYFKRFTMDGIWSCAFGIDTDVQNNMNDPYLTYAQEIFSPENFQKVLVLLSLFVSELSKLWNYLHRTDASIRYWLTCILPVTKNEIRQEPEKWIIAQAYKMIEQRAKHGCMGRTDLLQLMLESITDEEFIDDASTHQTKQDYNDHEMLSVKKLTKHEIASNIFLFMAAGFETTSTALSYVSYVLATHPEEQQKLQDEIDAHFDPQTEDDMPSYDTIFNMEYLDMFIRETLRMYPIAPFVINRQSSADFHLKGIGTIPAGTRIAVDIYSLHYDPELWGPVDPQVFYPERFATKRHPMAWIPFGAGPRNCVGMRFALMEMKMILVRLLKTYSIVSSGDATINSLKNLKEFIVIAPYEVIVQLQRRNGSLDETVA